MKDWHYRYYIMTIDGDVEVASGGLYTEKAAAEEGSKYLLGVHADEMRKRYGPLKMAVRWVNP